MFGVRVGVAHVSLSYYSPPRGGKERRPPTRFDGGIVGDKALTDGG